MKRLALVIFLILAASTVSATEYTVWIHGHAYWDQGSMPVQGEDVYVHCYSDEECTQLLEEDYDTTSPAGDGYYEVWMQENYGNPTCYAGDYAKTCVGEVCTECTLIPDNGMPAELELDLYGANPEIPEFGLAAAIVACIGALAGFMLLRKR